MTKLRIWLNAFIPRHVPDYTILLRRGPHASKTAIPMPAIARFPNRDSWPSWRAMRRGVDDGRRLGYLTDQRDFSNEPRASTRMRSWAELTVARQRVDYAGVGEHETSGTTELDLDTGEQLGRVENSDMGRCFWYAPPLFRRAASIKLDLHGTAGDPLVTLAAPIDYQGAFHVSVEGDRLLVRFDGRIDHFPAFEAYARFGQETKTILREPPPRGNTVVNLLNPILRRMEGRAEFRLT